MAPLRNNECRVTFSIRVSSRRYIKIARFFYVLAVLTKVSMACSFLKKDLTNCEFSIVKVRVRVA